MQNKYLPHAEELVQRIRSQLDTEHRDSNQNEALLTLDQLQAQIYQCTSYLQQLELVIDSTGMGGPFSGGQSFVEESSFLFTKIGNRAETTIDTAFAAAAAAFAQSQASALSDATATDSSVFETEVQIVDTIGSGVMMPCGQSEDEEAECR